MDAFSRNDFIDLNPLRTLGDRMLNELWQALDSKANIQDADIEYPGMAHGWAGFLYATLQWCSVSKTALPKCIERRLQELADLAFDESWPRLALGSWPLRRTTDYGWLVQWRLRLCLSLDSGSPCFGRYALSRSRRRRCLAQLGGA